MAGRHPPAAGLFVAGRHGLSEMGDRDGQRVEGTVGDRLSLMGGHRTDLAVRHVVGRGRRPRLSGFQDQRVALVPIGVFIRAARRVITFGESSGLDQVTLCESIR
jgi:hypothetical protein